MREDIYDYCMKRIRDARGVPVRLDTERGLAQRFGVSLRVARGVLQQLVREGHAVSQQGRGYFSRPSAKRRTRGRLKVGFVYGPDGAEGLVGSRAQEYLLGALVAKLETLGIGVKLFPVRRSGAIASVRRVIEENPVDAYVLCSVPPTFHAFFAGLGKPALVHGSVDDDLGLPSIERNQLELSRKVTERLLASGHRRICLLQERISNIGLERARLGFEYAYGIRRLPFRREQIILIDRRQRGWRPAIAQLSKVSPTGLLVQTAPMLEKLWDRAGEALERKLASIEVLVLEPDWLGQLRHPATIIRTDKDLDVRTTAQLVTQMLGDRPLRKRYHELPWKLVSKP